MWQSARLTMSEQIDCRSKYQILQLLKKKGVPVIGTVFPKLDFSNYEFKKWFDSKNLDDVYEWRKRED